MAHCPAIAAPRPLHMPPRQKTRAHTRTFFSEKTRLILLPVAIAVDANRDGVIKFSGNCNDPEVADKPFDTTSKEKPFRFWVNDGVDGYCQDPNESSVQDDLEPTYGMKNCKQLYATCERDLQNFARLWISTRGLNQSIRDGNITIGLEWQTNDGFDNSGWRDYDGAPAINIYEAAPKHGESVRTGSADYLTDPDTATDQVSSEYGAALGSAAKGKPFYFSASTFENLTEDSPNTYFLFEGAARGTGRLVVTFNTGSAGNYKKIGEGGALYMDLKNIKELYVRYTVGDGNGTTPSSMARLSKERLSPAASAFEYDSSHPGLSDPSDANGNKYIMIVHGWNLRPWERDTLAETSLKRLYWQGYKGKLAAFQWPTTYGSEVGAIMGYDDGEFIAWKSAPALRNKLLDLRWSSSVTGVYLLAHSMGNVVAGEALRLAAQDGSGQIVKSYLACQAALPVHCYDPSQATPIDYFNSWRTVKKVGPIPINLCPTMDTPNIYNNWMAGNSGAVSSLGRVNFFNANDYALSRVVWESDQALKPDIRLNGVYYYASIDLTTVQDLFMRSSYLTPYMASTIILTHTGFFPTTLHLGTPANVQDRYEIMAYASEPRCRALGATPNAAGFGSASLQDLWPNDLFNGNNYSTHPWHSAQFRFTNSDQKDYWHNVLYKFELLPETK